MPEKKKKKEKTKREKKKKHAADSKEPASCIVGYLEFS